MELADLSRRPFRWCRNSEFGNFIISIKKCKILEILKPSFVYSVLEVFNTSHLLQNIFETVATDAAQLSKCSSAIFTRLKRNYMSESAYRSGLRLLNVNFWWMILFDGFLLKYCLHKAYDVCIFCNKVQRNIRYFIQA